MKSDAISDFVHPVNCTDFPPVSWELLCEASLLILDQEKTEDISHRTGYNRSLIQDSSFSFNDGELKCVRELD